MPKTCPVGHHCNDPAELFQCQPGTYQNDTNTTVCKPCELGQYCPTNGMDTTIPCHIGTYQNLTGQKECIPCPEKTNCIQGMNIIKYLKEISKQISSLFFQFKKVGTVNYGVCRAGYECKGGQPNQCAIGTFNGEVNSICKTCPDGQYTEKRKYTISRSYKLE